MRGAAIETDPPAWPTPEVDGSTLIDLLDTQFAATPDLIAVRDAERALTYGELDARSASLAARLTTAGAGPGTIVALCMERSVDLAIAVTGSLRAGCAYLPLATTDPAARLERLVEDAQPAFVVTDDHRVADPAFGDRPRIVPVDWSGAADPAADLARVESADLAYVIYTSGSTGQPKGVLTEHGAIVNRLLWMQRRFGIGPGDVVAQKTPYTFDVSVWELLWPLITGAELAFAEPGGHRDPRYLSGFFRQHRVTVAHFVPSMLAEYVRAVRPGDGPHPRQLMISGEALDGRLVARCFEQLPGVDLHNLYGPTEAAIDVTHWECRRDAAPEAPVPIGHPITGIDLHVLDEDGRALPDGTVGELYIAGVGVARGYLGRPDLTEERFLPSPGGGRMYRTGDLASRGPDGAYLYHGRTDRQVKIGGVRVELGEVEAALRDLPYVDDAAVVVRRDTADRARLDAVIVPLPGRSWDGWRRDLLATLPAGLIPSSVTATAALPQTAHGKSDADALRALVEAAESDRGDDEPESDPIAQVWRAILGSAQPDFFDAGGTSLLAVRLLAEIATRTGTEIGVADFLGAPTLPRLRALAARSGPGRTEAPARTAASAGPLLNRYQERLWFLQQLEPDSTAMSAPTGLRLIGVSQDEVTRAFAALTARHDVLRTRYPTHDGVAAAAIDPATPTIIWEDRPGLNAGERAAVGRQAIEAEAYEPFDLAAGPPVRVRGLSFSGTDHLLVLAAHQIAIDGWSWSLIAHELAGDPATGGVHAQIADHAVWQRTVEGTAAHAATTEAALRHWRDTLADAPDGLNLPVDRPRAGTLSVPAGWVPIAWPEGTVQTLRELCRRLKVTEFVVLLAAYGAWLARLADQEVVLVGTPLANRTPPWTATLVGNFVTTVPQRLDVGDDPTFAELLVRTRETVLNSQRHSGVPIERIVAEVGGARGAGRLPLFQNLFVFQDLPPWQQSADGRSVEVVQFPPRHTHYDLKFEVFPGTPAYEARLVYARGRISDERAALMARQLGSLLAAAVADVDGYVADLPLFEPAGDWG